MNEGGQALTCDVVSVTARHEMPWYDVTRQGLTPAIQ